MLGFIWYWYHRRAAAKDAERITQMLQIVLVKLRENVHDGEAQPRYLIPARLRDELLQHETAVMERLRIWGMVERAVGGNANILTSLVETDEGEETVVWTWVGTSE